MRCRKGFKNANISNVLFVFERCIVTDNFNGQYVQTNFHNALTRVIQFICTRRRSYKTTSFEKEQFIA